MRKIKQIETELDRARHFRYHHEAIARLWGNMERELEAEKQKHLEALYAAPPLRGDLELARGVAQSVAGQTDNIVVDYDASVKNIDQGGAWVSAWLYVDLTPYSED